MEVATRDRKIVRFVGFSPWGRIEMGQVVVLMKKANRRDSFFLCCRLKYYASKIYIETIRDNDVIEPGFYGSIWPEYYP